MPWQPREKRMLPIVPEGTPEEQRQFLKRHFETCPVCKPERLIPVAALIALLSASVAFAGVGKRCPDGPQVSVGDVCPKAPATLNGSCHTPRLPMPPWYLRFLLPR